jgi:hypothetical protein
VSILALSIFKKMLNSASDALIKHINIEIFY